MQQTQTETSEKDRRLSSIKSRTAELALSRDMMALAADATASLYAPYLVGAPPWSEE